MDENKNKYKGILAIDFDDTIVYTNFPDIIISVKNSKKYINKLYDEGWYIIIWTCRCDDDSDVKALTIATNYLKNEGIKYHKINQHNDYLLKIFGNNTRKIAADFYIDDKNIFKLPPWRKIYKYLNRLKGHISCLEYKQKD